MIVRAIPLDKIFITKNVRLEADGELGELMASTARYGQLQPVGVKPRPGGRYELVWGHRRLRVAIARNEPTLDCRILEGISDLDIPLIKLQENVQRKQLTAEEVVAAADEIERRNPGLTDSSVDHLIGKSPGYISNCRSTLRVDGYLRGQGISKKQVEALNDDEKRALRAEMEAAGRRRGTRKSTFHRGDRTPARGFRVVNSPGPNVVVVCADKKVKLRVIRDLRDLSRRCAP